MLGDLWDSISGWISDTLSSLLESILNATIFRLFYYLEYGLCYIIDVLYKMFEVFAGLTRVTYNNSSEYLINIFFSNKAVNNIYWGMALIGIALTIGFTVFAVVRKSFDSSGKQQQSHGQILWAAVRSVLIIVGMTAIMTVVLNTTGTLMQRINDLFKDPYHLNDPIEREFSGEEYAAMGRVLATIGNYSVVESENSRYNLNLCFNDIRPDMLYLQKQGVFNYSYIKKDEEGNVVDSWQSVLAKIATSCDLKQDVKVDIYNDGVARSIRNAMNFIQNNAIPKALEKITRDTFEDEYDGHLDTMVFLMGTMRAAKSSYYNQKPAFDDALRGPYYYGIDKSIYNFDQVDSDFKIGFQTDYIVVWIAAIGVIINLVVIIMNCVARIFNMLFLYLIAPPIIAVQPLDGGAKTKQWMTAFLVQSLSVFGTVIAMRLLLLFIPIIIDPQLVLFEKQPVLNAIAKYILIYGGFEAAKKSSSILTGILADSAGWQAIQAGDMSGSAMKAIGAATGVGKAIAGTGLKVGGAVLGTATRPLTNVIKRPFAAAAEHWNALGTGKATTEKGKLEEQIAQEKKLDAARRAAGIGPYANQGNGGNGGPGGGGPGGGGPGPGGGGQPPPQQNLQNNINQPNQNNQNNNPQQNLQNQQQPPPQPPAQPPAQPQPAQNQPAQQNQPRQAPDHLQHLFGPNPPAQQNQPAQQNNQPPQRQPANLNQNIQPPAQPGPQPANHAQRPPVIPNRINH